MVIKMSNIFTSENIMKDAKPTRVVGIGEYEKHNGFWALKVQPEPFYKNYSDDISACLYNCFKPDTQYYFDIWICNDDDSVGHYSRGGFVIRDTDGGYIYNFRVEGSDSSEYTHITYLSDASKSLAFLAPAYSNNVPVYYRYDSFIVPVDSNVQINKNGIVNCGEILQFDTDNLTIKGSHGLNGNDFIEN